MATRWYFPASQDAEVAPPFSDEWTYNSEAVRRKAVLVRGVSAITAGARIGPWTPGQLALDRQYVTYPIQSGVTFDSSVTVKGQLMAAEYATQDNVNQIVCGIKVVSNDGQTVRRVLLAPANYGTASELVTAATGRNKTFLDGDALAPSSPYTTVPGDRLVFEIGYLDNSGATPEASAKWGEAASDLPENETQTADGAGWVEFSNTFSGNGWAEYTPTVVSADANTVVLKIGPQSYEFPRDQIDNFIACEFIDPWSDMMWSMGKVLKLAGLSMENPAQVRSFIESRTFKMKVE